MNRCRQMQHGLQRCFLPDGHLEEHSFVPPGSDKAREFKLSLTYRMARAAVSVLRLHRKKCEREYQKNVAIGWKPEPGKFDANLSRVVMFDDMIKQLDDQIKKVDRKETE